METLTIGDKIRLLELAQQEATTEGISGVYRRYVSLVTEDDKETTSKVKEGKA